MRLCLIFFLLLFSFSAHAGLSKWVDSAGKVHYSDGPPPPEARVETVRIPTVPAASAPAPASGTPAVKSLADREMEFNKEQKAKAEAQKKAAAEQEKARLKAQNCASARSALHDLQYSPRIAAYDANGERTILDDSARQQRIDDANKAVSQYCD